MTIHMTKKHFKVKKDMKKQVIARSSVVMSTVTIPRLSLKCGEESTHNPVHRRSQARAS